MTARLIQVALMALATLATSQAAEFDPTESRERLDRIEARLRAAALDEQGLQTSIRESSEVRSEANACVNDLEPQVARIDEAVEANTTSERDAQPSSVTEELARLDEDKAALVPKLSECRLLVLRADELYGKLSTALREIVRNRLLHRDETLWQVAVTAARDPIPVLRALGEIALRGSGLRSLSREHLLVLTLFEVLAVALAFLFQPRLRDWFMNRPGDEFGPRALRSLGGALARYLPALALFGASVTFAVIVFSGQHPLPFMAHLSFSLLTFTLALIVTQGVLAPPGTTSQLTPLPDRVARSFSRRILLLVALLLTGQTVFVLLDASALPDNARALFGNILATALVINICSLVWLVGYIPKLERSGRGIRVALILAFVIVLLAEWLGYRNLTSYILTGFIRSVFLLLAALFVDALLAFLFRTLDGGAYRWQRSVRKSLSVEDDEPFPGLLWLRFLSALLVWSGTAFLFLKIWGLSAAGTAIIVRYLVDGFQIGDATIVPGKVLTGVFLALLLLTGLRWFRNALEERWLMRTRLDSGSRETLVALTTYTGFTVAILIGLSMAGFGFQNLAIVAGALSLGIGFGLQNIVNNFVSGIILLFERPVRPGDWVVVGTTEGYVKKVRVRSTEIQTFDRSDVIVPNSEFISAQVTNWTLRDPYGRLIVPVRVAFGTDPETVRDLLLEVAREHPQVVQFGIVPAPVVLFRGFGDNSFSFELRCFIRDINWKLSVISDLYFAIEKAFRDKGIQIPVPQMDMRLQRWNRETHTLLNEAERPQAVEPIVDPDVKPG